MDCPICLNNIKNSAVGSCMHHFCFNCIVNWCESGGTRCPICKVAITKICLDKEFDQINIDAIADNSNSNTSVTYKASRYDIEVEFTKNTFAGITLENNYDYFGFGARGPGVVISNINKKDQCYKSGLRKGNILLFINNIPCIDHKQAIDIVNNSVLSNNSITCSLLNLNKPIHCYNSNDN